MNLAGPQQSHYVTDPCESRCTSIIVITVKVNVTLDILGEETLELDQMMKPTSFLDSAAH